MTKLHQNLIDYAQKQVYPFFRPHPPILHIKILLLFQTQNSYTSITRPLKIKLLVLGPHGGGHWTAKIGGGGLDGRLGKYSISFILIRFYDRKSLYLLNFRV